MPPAHHSFFIRGDDGEEYGPVDLDELREWVQENRAGLGTAVRLDELDASWYPWQHYPELVALLAEAQVTSPVPGQPGLVIASLWKRILACLVDLTLGYFLALPIFSVLTILYAPNWFIQVTLALVRSENSLPQPPFEYAALVNLILYLALMLYMAGFHAVHGKTPAKSVLRIRVVDQNGQKPHFVKSFLRALALIFSLYLYGIPMAYAFFNPQRRAFHDFVAGTYVVET